MKTGSIEIDLGEFHKKVEDLKITPVEESHRKRKVNLNRGRLKSIKSKTDIIEATT